MGTVNIQKREYKGWKNCIEISNGIVDLIATTDVGPRIIRFGFVGKENEFCEVENHLGTSGADEWVMYGGHRLWHSPEVAPRTYEPDNSKITWRKKKNGIVLTQPVESISRMAKEIEIIMDPDKAEVKLLHRLTNQGAWTAELSVWPITVMAPGGREVVPQITAGTNLLPNRSISLWPYSKMNDPRIFWGEKYIMLKQDKDIMTPFKVGLPNKDGWAAYANHNHLFVKKYTHYDEVEYPDFGASYETYTINFMVEMETLSPMIPLDPGDTLEHTETWNLFDNVKVPASEKDVDEFILPLVK